MLQKNCIIVVWSTGYMEKKIVPQHCLLLALKTIIEEIPYLHATSSEAFRLTASPK